MTKLYCWLLMASALASLAGCATEVTRSRAEFRAADPAQRRSIEATGLVTLNLATGYQRSIITGSRWEWVGVVPEGEVFRPVGTVFTIEGANMHEAFIVVRDSKVVGFYLPGEGAFSALEPAVVLPYKLLN